MNAASTRVLLTLAVLALHATPCDAEPYIAVQQGYRCAQCHYNLTGGGLRNEFGSIYAQNLMPAHTVGDGATTWSGRIGKFAGLGANLRADWRWTDVPHQPSSNDFAVSDARIYLLVEPLPGRLGIYVDERVAPGTASNLEGYVRYATIDAAWSIQAGRMYLPFGLRLEDDSAFTRTLPGINMTTPDDGLQVAWESARWSAQLAVSNGTGGGPETDTGKQFTGQVVRVEPAWRLGIAAALNDSDAGDRAAWSVFGGLRTGPVAWLGEAVGVRDRGYPDGTRKQWAGLLEADWSPRKGHNLKLTAEWLDPDADVDEDEQNRWSVVYELTPIQFLQVRAGARFNDGIPQNDGQNARMYFVELHGFF